jgi:DNA gyrase subunit A
MNLEKGDELVSVAQVGDAKDIIMVSEKGQAIRFPVSDLSPRSRSAGGVRGMRLQAEDRVVSMATVTDSGYLLVVSQGGYGKSTAVSSYPQQSRGGQGVRTFRVTPKTGPVAAARVVPDAEGQEIFIISAKAQVMRMTLEDVRVTGRNTLGVIIWRDREPDDHVASIACFQDTNPVPAESNGQGPVVGGKRARSRQNGSHPTNGAASER